MRSPFAKSFRLDWSQVAAVNILAVLAWAVIVSLPWDASASGGASALAPNMPVATGKRIAISFDDAPRGPGAFVNQEQRPAMLIAALKQAGVAQAVFFANPARVGPSNRHAAAIQAYVNAGHVVANHTANHLVLSQTSAAAFMADVDAAEDWLKPHKNYRPWLRFPQLDEGGHDAAKRDAVRAGMKARGLLNGYASADGWDWYMESLTIKAAKAQRPMDMAALRNLYIETHVQSADFADKLARRSLGRAPAQMLLLHETDLAALYVRDLIAALRADGWTIITADEAYKDPIYRQQPVIADANGTIVQMLSWEKGAPGPRWYARNETGVMQKLFAERVLRD